MGLEEELQELIELVANLNANSESLCVARSQCSTFKQLHNTFCYTWSSWCWCHSEWFVCYFVPRKLSCPKINLKGLSWVSWGKFCRECDGKMTPGIFLYFDSTFIWGQASHPNHRSDNQSLSGCKATVCWLTCGSVFWLISPEYLLVIMIGGVLQPCLWNTATLCLFLQRVIL